MEEIRTANRGEWSELYALLKLLAEGKLYPADNNLNLIEDNYYPISRVTTNADSDNKVIYIISSDEEITIQGNTTIVIKRAVVRKYIERFLEEISAKHETRGAFSVTDSDEILKLLNRTSISAASYQRADLVLETYDSVFKRVNEQGYSIKSAVGSASTLFNSSGQTNITYEILNIDFNQMEEIDSLESSRKKLEKIYELGGKLKYVHMDSVTFSNNLSLIDSNFDKIIAESVLIYNLTAARKVKDVVELLPDSELALGNFTHSLDFYKNNFRKFLFYSALGMVAGKEWDGFSTFDGGIIVVKRNGSLAGYNPSSLNKFQEYLYENTKFDTPDTRLKFGQLYLSEEKMYIKLNFQIRFTN